MQDEWAKSAERPPLVVEKPPLVVEKPPSVVEKLPLEVEKHVPPTSPSSSSDGRRDRKSLPDRRRPPWERRKSLLDRRKSP